MNEGRRPIGPLDDYCDDLEQELAKLERELTRWRAMFSSPEICKRELERLRSALAYALHENRTLRAENSRLIMDHVL